MTDKQKRFCNEYLIDCNATQAAIRAGYSPKTANEQSARLLANVSIKTYIEEQLNKMTSKSVADAEEVMKYGVLKKMPLIGQRKNFLIFSELWHRSRMITTLLQLTNFFVGGKRVEKCPLLKL